MVYEILNDLGGVMYGLFGNGMIFALVIIGGLIILLLAFRTPIVAILMILLPLLTGFVLNYAESDMIYTPAWVLVAIFVLMGLVFGTFWLFIVR